MIEFKIVRKIRELLNDRSEKNLLVNVAFAFLIKGLSLILSVFATPLYIKYFNNNTALGVWYTVLSVLSWISICDLGLSDGLRNRLTEALAEKDYNKAKSCVSSTYAILAIIMLPIIIIGNVWIWNSDLNGLLNVSEIIISSSALRTGITILFSGIMLNFILKTITSVFYAIQKAAINNFLSLTSSFIPFIYILIFKGTNNDENLIALAVVHSVATLLPLIIASIIVYSRPKFKGFSPSVNYIDMKTARRMMNFGIHFFTAQLFFLILMSTNELIITKLFSAGNVVDYNIYYRLFSFVGSIFMLALTPVWSKITLDVANKDYRRLRNTKKVLYFLALLAVMAEFLLVPILQFVVNIWLGEGSIQTDISVSLSFAFFGGIYIVNNVLTTIANGIGDLKSQIVFYGIGAMLKLPVILLLSRLSMNWNILVLYNGGVLFAFCVYQFFWTERKIKNLTEKG